MEIVSFSWNFLKISGIFLHFFGIFKICLLPWNILHTFRKLSHFTWISHIFWRNFTIFKVFRKFYAILMVIVSFVLKFSTFLWIFTLLLKFLTFSWNFSISFNFSLNIFQFLITFHMFLGNCFTLRRKFSFLWKLQYFRSVLEFIKWFHFPTNFSQISRQLPHFPRNFYSLTSNATTTGDNTLSATTGLSRSEAKQPRTFSTSGVKHPKLFTNTERNWRSHPASYRTQYNNHEMKEPAHLDGTASGLFWCTDAEVRTATIWSADSPSMPKPCRSSPTSSQLTIFRVIGGNVTVSSETSMPDHAASWARYQS